MNDKQKQIEEMAKVIIKAGESYYKMPVDIECANREAVALYEAGYSKQSDTAREILDEVSRHFGGAWLVELYKKYGVEVEE